MRKKDKEEGNSTALFDVMPNSLIIFVACFVSYGKTLVPRGTSFGTSWFEGCGLLQMPLKPVLKSEFWGHYRPK